MHIHRGEICGLIGPNGSGKSTFFDCSTGLGKPDAGKVLSTGRTSRAGPSTASPARAGCCARSRRRSCSRRSTSRKTWSSPVRCSRFRACSRPSASDGCRAQRVAALRERARELIRMAGLWDVRHHARGQPFRRAAEAHPVRLHADAGAQNHSSRRADGRHQPEHHRTCRRDASSTPTSRSASASS